MLWKHSSGHCFWVCFVAGRRGGPSGHRAIVWAGVGPMSHHSESPCCGNTVPGAAGRGGNLPTWALEATPKKQPSPGHRFGNPGHPRAIVSEIPGPTNVFWAAPPGGLAGPHNVFWGPAGPQEVLWGPLQGPTRFVEGPRRSFGGLAGPHNVFWGPCRAPGGLSGASQVPTTCFGGLQGPRRSCGGLAGPQNVFWGPCRPPGGLSGASQVPTTCFWGPAGPQEVLWGPC